ncbi:thioredoxin-disulfide reductase [Nanchangia anserum]|uniref:Thioredoxin reductase n=1 Tax=Nanchangia anserum TaxID=2692125 RepID=A0A8I0G9D3_9ACTO|nr:thioredoxin-disulfide reductase [Nanchangia anserum]MBD3689564.1 thioredoxin-disulfide reductase [Nanchangia anserum]QOX81749.1 thioredoxin-disulfide reductase [Nanchangia anserum]
MSSLHDVVIVGSGPAGYTAAIYAARAGLAPCVLAGEIDYGGALMTTTEVENFPGFPEGIQGPDLMDKLAEQAKKFGADVRMESATELDLAGDVKTIRTDDGTYQAKRVILAMGSAYRHLGVDGEERLSGKGVSYCATCDGFFFKDQHIAVVGGGDSAMEEALFLTNFASKVTIIHRRDSFRASQIMAQRALDHDKIEVAWNSTVDSINGEDRVESVTLRDTGDDSLRTLDATAVFIAIGHDPRSGLVAGQVETDDAGYVIVDEPSTRTSLEGVYACGDLVDHTYRQAITAAGTGARAAIDAERSLR